MVESAAFVAQYCDSRSKTYKAPCQSSFRLSCESLTGAACSSAGMASQGQNHSPGLPPPRPQPPALDPLHIPNFTSCTRGFGDCIQLVGTFTLYATPAGDRLLLQACWTRFVALAALVVQYRDSPSCHAMHCANHLASCFLSLLQV